MTAADDHLRDADSGENADDSRFVEGDPKERVADRFAKVDLAADRFINVLDGKKGTRDHDTRYSDPRDVPGTNYGIYPGDGVVYLDVDDYDDGTASDGLDALAELPETFTTESPHTDGDPGGHRFYHVTGSVTDRLEDAFGTANPQPSWGEVRAHHQYVVGPGSQLDGCGKAWCDECGTPDGGRYEIALDIPIATISAADLVDVLRQDPDLTTTSDGGVAVADSTPTPKGDDDGSPADYDPTGTPFEDVIDAEPTLATYLNDGPAAAGFEASDGGGDRSRADYYACCVAAEYGVPGEEVRDQLAECPHSKVDVPDAARDYWRRTWTAVLADDEVEPNSKILAAGDSDGEDSDTIQPHEVLERAVESRVCPIKRDDEGNLPSIRTLRQSERAEFVWQLAKQKDRDNVVAVAGSSLYRYEDGVWRRDMDGTALTELGREALRSAYTTSMKNELEERVRDDNTIPSDTLGAPDGAVATEAGLLDLEPAIESGSLADLGGPEPLQPDHYARHKLPVDPDPDADAPRFEAFVAESVADGAVAKLQEYAGYVLWHHAQPFGKALFLLGPTDSGKGTFLRILKGVLGGADAPLAAESLQDLTSRWGAAQLFGKWANVRNEVTPGDVDDIQKFKEFTGGGDRVSAEFKGQDKFDFDVTQKFIFAMNQLPDIDNTDRAFWNRLLLVQFPETVPTEEQDPTLAETIIAEEAAGVLNWMIEGLIRLLDREAFTNERPIEEKRDLVGQYGDVFDRFMDDVVDRTGDDYDYVVKRDLLALANAYADEHDMDTPWNGQRGFSRRIHGRGIGSMRTSHGFDERTRVYTGVRIDGDAADGLGIDVDHGQLTNGDSTQETL